MLNKRLGIVLIVVSVLVGFVIFSIMNKLNVMATDFGCFPITSECVRVENFLSFTHVAIGIIAFLFALGIYLAFFSKSEEAILNRLEENKNKELGEEKFNIILKALDDYEKKVLRAVKEQDGITQNTLRLRTDMSKAKLSYVLQELEKRNLIKRVKKGKTLAVWLKI